MSSTRPEFGIWFTLFLWVIPDFLCDGLIVSHRKYVSIQICTIFFNLKNCTSTCNNLQYIVFLLRTYLPWVNSSTGSEIHGDIVTATVFICCGEEKLFKHHASFYCKTGCLQQSIWCYIFLCSDSWKWVVRHVRPFAASHIKDTSDNSGLISGYSNRQCKLYIWKTKRLRRNSQISEFSNVDSQHSGIHWIVTPLNTLQDDVSGVNW